MRLMRYLRSLTWPRTVAQLADLLSKTIIAAVAATIGFVYHQYQQQQIDLAASRAHDEAVLQRQLAAQREAREDARSTYGFLITGMPDTFSSEGAMARLRIMIGYCNDPVNARERIVATACKNLPMESIGHKLNGAPLVEAAATPGYANSEQAQADKLNAAIAEAATPPPLDARWFTVVATVPLADRPAAEALLRTLTGALRGAGFADPLQLWRTRISHSFAVTVGGPRNEIDAVALASRIRASGIVADAFAQPDRDWTPDATTGD